jgi:hypothetical protein
MDFLENFSVKLQAKDLPAVLVAWTVCVALLGLFGNGQLASSALGILGGSLGMLVFILMRLR